MGAGLGLISAVFGILVIFFLAKRNQKAQTPETVLFVCTKCDPNRGKQKRKHELNTERDADLGGDRPKEGDGSGGLAGKTANDNALPDPNAMGGPQMFESIKKEFDADAEWKRISYDESSVLYERTGIDGPARHRAFDVAKLFKVICGLPFAKETCALFPRGGISVSGRNRIRVKETRCLSFCDNANCIAVRSNTKYSFQFSNLSPSDSCAVSEYCKMYVASEDGFSKSKDRPKSLRSKVCSRIPPITW